MCAKKGQFKINIRKYTSLVSVDSGNIAYRVAGSAVATKFVLGLKMNLGQGLPLHPQRWMHSINIAQYAGLDVMCLALKVYAIL